MNNFGYLFDFSFLQRRERDRNFTHLIEMRDQFVLNDEQNRSTTENSDSSFSRI